MHQANSFVFKCQTYPGVTMSEAPRETAASVQGNGSTIPLSRGEWVVNELLLIDRLIKMFIKDWIFLFEVSM